MKRHVFLACTVLPCVAFLLVLAAAAIAHVNGADIMLLNPKGPIAFEQRHVILLTLALSSIVIIPTFFALFFFAWRYRADGPHAKDAHEPDWDHDSVGAEFFWWLVPTVIIIALAFVSWDSSHALDPYKPIESPNKAITVQVVALNWKWLFIYPELGVASINDLEIPAGTPMHFLLTADAPMNSFWIPSLGGQIMVMPGMTTELNLMANATGTFKGFSANISGEGFAGMEFQTHSLTDKEFASWISAAHGDAALGMDEYMTLAQPSTNTPPTTYKLSDTTLFDAIVGAYMAPGGMKGMGSMQMGSMHMP
jgi:cytochrome o ubiquinol oxidase subunit 2